MHTSNIHQAKTHLSELINLALAGEQVVIAKAGKPLIELVIYQQPKFIRKGGKLRGLLKIGADFDAPLPEAIAKSFQGEGEGT